MALKYTFNDPNQVIKITFPFKGKINYKICGGGGGGGGPDAYPANDGASSSFFKGTFNVDTSDGIVLQPGGAGLAGGWSGAGQPGGNGGEGIMRGGAGGNGGPAGTSGAGGGGGAGSFIMEFLEYQKLATNNFFNIKPIIVSGGGRGGGGAGRWGADSRLPDGNYYKLSTIEGLYGRRGGHNFGDGGGGGGGGGGWKEIFNGQVSGGGNGGPAAAGDITGVSGYEGSNYYNSLAYLNLRVLPLNRTVEQEYKNFGLGGGPSSRGTNGFVEIEYIPDNQDTSKIYTKHNGSFIKVPEIYVRANNNTVWQQVKDVYVKNNGDWVNVFNVVDEQQFAPTLQNINTIIKGPLNKGSDLGWVASQWGTWWFGYYPILWDYGISKTSIWTLGQNEFTTTVFIPTAGNYRMFVASDDSGYCTINCERGTSIDSYNTWPGYKEYIVNLPKGEVYLTAGYTNNDGPGAIAVLLTDMSLNAIWNTRAWVAGTYTFTYNSTEAGIIGNPVCGTITNLTPEAPPPEPYYGGDGGGGG